MLRSVRSECYDVSLDFQGLLKTAALGVLAGATERVGFARDLVWEYPAHWFYHRRVAASAGARHVVDLNFLLAQAAGAKGTRPPAQLAASPQDERAIAELLRDESLDRFVVINPGGGWPTKRWPPRRYGGLARMIRRETGAEVVVTTGPGEEALYEEMARHCGEPAPRHLRVPFLQLIPLLRRTSLLVGGDTGPFHLACALGVPVVGIFGPTSPARNGPWSPRDASVVRRLPCSFCHGRTCPTQNECMEISVEEVWAAVQRRLAAERTGRE